MSVPEGALVNYDKGCERAGAMAPAGLAMTVHRLNRRTPIFEPDIAAEATPRSRFILHRVCHLELSSRLHDKVHPPEKEIAILR